MHCVSVDPMVRADADLLCSGVGKCQQNDFVFLFRMI